MAAFIKSLMTFESLCTFALSVFLLIAFALPSLAATEAHPATDRDKLSINGSSESATKIISCAIDFETRTKYIDKNSNFSPTNNLLYTSSSYLDYLIGGTLKLRENINIYSGEHHLSADEATYNPKSGHGELFGEIRFTTPNIETKTNKVKFNLHENEYKLGQSSFILHTDKIDFRGSMHSLNYKNKDFSARSGSITSCPFGNNSWQLSGKSLSTKNAANQILIRDAVLRIAGIPVFYYPYLSFATNEGRKSGFLSPDFNLNSRDGVKLSVPFYLNIASNFDSIIELQAVSNRGIGIHGNIRHLSRNMYNQIQLDYIPKDNLYNGSLSSEVFTPTTDVPDFIPVSRWGYQIKHQGTWTKSLSSTISYSRISDGDFLRDWKSDIDANHDHIKQEGSLEFKRNNIDMRLSIQFLKPLESEVINNYIKLPELRLRYKKNTGFLNWDFFSLLTRFQATETNNSQQTDRLHFEPKITFLLERPYGGIGITTNLRYTRYSVPEVLATEAQNQLVRFSPVASVSARLAFYRPFNLKDRSIVHIIESNFYYVWAKFQAQDALPVFDTSRNILSYQQIFRENQFSGYDRLSSENRISLGVTNRLIDSATELDLIHLKSGITVHLNNEQALLNEQIFANVEQRFYSKTSITNTLDWFINPFFSFSGNWVYSLSNLDTDELSLFLKYRGTSRTVFNLGYRKRNSALVGFTIHQSIVSMQIPLSKRFGFSASWLYDIESNRNIKLLAGFEYANCCWNIQVYWRKWRRYNFANELGSVTSNGIYIQFSLQGFLKLNSGIDSVLKSSISGYSPLSFTTPRK